jgi:site-specific DNA recombinase
MKTAVYARVSSDSQDVDLSISAQLRAVRDYAAKHGYEIVREYVDEAESGRTTDRPAFKEMITMAKTKNPPFEAILVWKMNRFSRSRLDSITYKTLLRNKGIKIISINEALDNSPSGQLLEGIIESVDEFYSANLGQDIKRGMRENAERGYYSGGRAPYGLRRVPVVDGAKTRYKLEPEPADSISVQAVRRMFELAFTGKGCEEIAKILNRDMILTSNDQRWGKTTVHKVLTNEAYCGTLVWGGRPGHKAIRNGEPPVRAENAWPALIDKETFIAVQEKMASTAPRAIHPRTIPSFYLLSGLLFCSCGHAMIGRSAKSHQYYYYMCNKSCKQGREACNTKNLPKDKLEGLVIDQIKEYILTEQCLEELVRLVNEELDAAQVIFKQKLSAVDNELNDVKLRLSRLYDALETKKLSLDDLSPRIRELRLRQDELSKARVLTESEMVAKGVGHIDVKIVKSYAEDLKSLLQESDFTQSKAFLRSFVKRIEIDGDKVVIKYNLPLPAGKKREKVEEVLPMDTLSGDRGIRTPDLLRAREALSQLSYIPVYNKMDNVMFFKTMQALMSCKH